MAAIPVVRLGDSLENEVADRMESAAQLREQAARIWKTRLQTGRMLLWISSCIVPIPTPGRSTSLKDAVPGIQADDKVVPPRKRIATPTFLH